MNFMLSLSFLIQGLVGGVLTLVILAARAAIEGRSGVTFADLWTAVAVGVAVGLVALLTPRLAEWQIRRACADSAASRAFPRRGPQRTTKQRQHSTAEWTASTSSRTTPARS